MQTVVALGFYLGSRGVSRGFRNLLEFQQLRNSREFRKGLSSVPGGVIRFYEDFRGLQGVSHSFQEVLRYFKWFKDCERFRGV